MAKVLVCTFLLMTALPALAVAGESPFTGTSTSIATVNRKVDYPDRDRYSSEPNVRMVQLLGDAEWFRQFRREKARFWGWGTNRSSYLSFDRLNGAIGP